MFALIKKEFIAHKLLTLILLFVALFYFPLMLLIYSEAGMIPLAFMWTTIIFFLYYFRDQKLNGLQLTCSLPSTRQKIILTKYITGWLYLIGFILFTFLISMLTLIVAGGNGLQAFDGATIITFPKGFFIVSLIIGIFYPIAIRYGTFVGMLIAGIVINFLGLILYIIAKMFSSSAYSVFDYLFSIFDIISSAALSLIEITGVTVFVLLSVLTIFSINYLSYKSAVVLFKHRDL